MPARLPGRRRRGRGADPGAGTRRRRPPPLNPAGSAALHLGAADPLAADTLAAGASSGSVGAGVIAAVLLAAVLHALWNALAHAIEDRLVGFALIGIAVTIGAAVIVVLAPSPARASWGFLGTSVALHVVYTVLLMLSYRAGDFGQVYPIARGTSPWLVAIGASAFAGEHLPAIRLAGVLVVSAGLATLVFAGGVPTRAARPVLGAALLTGVAIASYTTVDGLGVRHAGSVAGYTGWLFLLQGPVLPLVAWAVRRGELVRALRPHVVAGLAGGALSLAAYGLVLWAQARGALAPIAALRETSVIFGALIGALVFHERFGRWRIAATVLVATGVVLINL